MTHPNFVLPAARADLGIKYGVYIMSHDVCQKWTPPSDTVLIRILSGLWPFGPLKNPDAFADILEVKFDDVDGIGGGQLPIQEKHAKLIVDFFEKNKGRKLAVHCHAGMSRSPATAAAWLYFHDNKEGETAIWDNKMFVCNRLVYRMVTEEVENRRFGKRLRKGMIEKTGS